MDIHEIIYTDLLKNHQASANKHNLMHQQTWKQNLWEHYDASIAHFHNKNSFVENFDKSTLTEKNKQI